MLVPRESLCGLRTMAQVRAKIGEAFTRATGDAMSTGSSMIILYRGQDGSQIALEEILLVDGARTSPFRWTECVTVTGTCMFIARDRQR